MGTHALKGNDDRNISSQPNDIGIIKIRVALE
jgi:hypothetical protein